MRQRTTHNDENERREPMQYSLMIYQTDAQFAARTDPARRDAANGAFMHHVLSLQETGMLLIASSALLALTSRMEI